MGFRPNTRQFPRDGEKQNEWLRFAEIKILNGPPPNMRDARTTHDQRIGAALTVGVSGDGELDTDSGAGVASTASSSGEAMGAAEGLSGESFPPGTETGAPARKGHTATETRIDDEDGSALRKDTEENRIHFRQVLLLKGLRYKDIALQTPFGQGRANIYSASGRSS